MKSSKEYIIEDLLQETEKTLQDLGDVDTLLELEADELEDAISDTVRKQFIETESEGQDFKIDGYAEITLSEDEMEAYADFYPPSEGKNPLSLDDLITMLDRKKIAFGIKWEVIKENNITDVPFSGRSHDLHQRIYSSLYR